MPSTMAPDPPIDLELQYVRGPATRSFSVALPRAEDVQYFVVVQDVVFNLLFFGPGQARHP